MKYRIAHYRKCGSEWLINGGNLIIEHNTYIIKGLFGKEVTFNINKSNIKRIPDYGVYKGLSFSSNDCCYELYFFPNTAKKLCIILDIN